MLHRDVPIFDEVWSPRVKGFPYCTGCDAYMCTIRYIVDLRPCWMTPLDLNCVVRSFRTKLHDFAHYGLRTNDDSSPHKLYSQTVLQTSIIACRSAEGCEGASNLVLKVCLAAHSETVGEKRILSFVPYYLQRVPSLEKKSESTPISC